MYKSLGCNMRHYFFLLLFDKERTISYTSKRPALCPQTQAVSRHVCGILFYRTFVCCPINCKNIILNIFHNVFYIIDFQTEFPIE